jgi:hypothetical protein
VGFCGGVLAVFYGALFLAAAGPGRLRTGSGYVMLADLNAGDIAALMKPPEWLAT